ncbi:unnamed protein product, partial [Ectocarpus sp. 13 AM-2016]
PRNARFGLLRHATNSLFPHPRGHFLLNNPLDITAHHFLLFVDTLSAHKTGRSSVLHRSRSASQGNQKNTIDGLATKARNTPISFYLRPPPLPSPRCPSGSTLQI